jgi:hypothetical protein
MRHCADDMLDELDRIAVICNLARTTCFNVQDYVMLCIFFVRGARRPRKSPTGAQDVLS